jgi:hypothetical protein
VFGLDQLHRVRPGARGSGNLKISVADEWIAQVVGAVNPASRELLGEQIPPEAAAVVSAGVVGS